MADRAEVALGAGVLLLGLGLAAGAVGISSEAGYSGVGPNFLPWVVALSLAGCGAMLLREAFGGGFREREAPDPDAPPGHWPGFAWVSAGILLNAALITTLGFVLSCALCFVFAVRGFKASAGAPDFSPRAWATDLAVGIAIAGPVYWMFTKALAISLPGLTNTGWL